MKKRRMVQLLFSLLLLLLAHSDTAEASVSYSFNQMMEPTGGSNNVLLGSTIGVTYNGSTIVTTAKDSVTGFLAYWVYRRPNSGSPYALYTRGNLNTNPAVSDWPYTSGMCMTRTGAQYIFAGFPQFNGDGEIHVLQDTNDGTYSLRRSHHFDDNLLSVSRLARSTGCVALWWRRHLDLQQYLFDNNRIRDHSLCNACYLRRHLVLLL